MERPSVRFLSSTSTPASAPMTDVACFDKRMPRASTSSATSATWSEGWQLPEPRESDWAAR
eukprot:scaffold3026_cov221-Pinguiococcus_pyrenoidosus.AAC.8